MPCCAAARRGRSAGAGRRHRSVVDVALHAAAVAGRNPPIRVVAARVARERNSGRHEEHRAVRAVHPGWDRDWAKHDIGAISADWRFDRCQAAGPALARQDPVYPFDVGYGYRPDRALAKQALDAELAVGGTSEAVTAASSRARGRNRGKPGESDVVERDSLERIGAGERVDAVTEHVADGGVELFEVAPALVRVMIASARRYGMHVGCDPDRPS